MVLQVNLLHIGKTGGSAIKNTIKEKNIILTNANYEIKLCGHDKILGTSSGFYAFFVRDPIERYVSGFLSRLRKGQPLYDVPHSPDEELAFKNFGTPNQLAETLSSTDPVRNQLAISAMESIFHVKNGLKYYLGGRQNLINNMDRILYVGRTEFLDDDFPQMLEKFQINRTELITDEVKIHKTPEQYYMMKHLSPLAIENLLRWYAEDYEIIDCLVEKGFLPSDYKSKRSYSMVEIKRTHFFY
jgi:hypothetical protein